MKKEDVEEIVKEKISAITGYPVKEIGPGFDVYEELGKKSMVPEFADYNPEQMKKTFVDMVTGEFPSHAEELGPLIQSLLRRPLTMYTAFRNFRNFMVIVWEGISGEAGELEEVEELHKI